ncbi:hypothetical protein QBC40DRAFT_278356 [Triangularia verruculosa]|uniref:2EXR domain-containing protein n=1 Tax=Triangularia verruculosa TaxID=2587418 RepID=A0AAN6XIQ5_9PEZI|nr:hypothetical protein QBC40DRAFT_278356 [Triangularia verruculosa]
MAVTFPLFAHLPWELRNLIWESAIRPDIPGAHIFTVSDNATTECGDSTEFEHHQTACQPRSVQTNTGHLRTVFHANWAQQNSSTYLIDSGLWMACRESRTAIERHFRRKQDKLLAWGPAAGSDGPSQFASESSTKRQVVFCPTQDLLILQSSNLTPFRWAKKGVLDLQTPTYEKPLRSCSFWTELQKTPGERHIAIPYNPAWDTMCLDWDELEGFVEFLLEASTSAPVHLWFIDYRLKRRIRVPTEEQLEAKGDCEKPREFHGSDCRYVEVSDKDGGSFQDGEWSDGFKKSRWHPLNNETRYYRNGVRGCVRRARSLICPDAASMQIGILACESV